MSDQDAFEQILASLHDAMLDDAEWPATSALIDEACGTHGNALFVREGSQDDSRVLCVGLYYRGQRRADWEREYLDLYLPINECIPRIRQLPDSHLVHLPALYTPQELQTSLTYNELFPRRHAQNSVNARLDGPDGSTAGAAQGATAPYSAVCPHPPSAGRRRGPGRIPDPPPRQHPDWHHPFGPVRADSRRQ